MKSIAIAGSIAQKPGRGGHTWVFLQYLLGFQKLGWDVVFIDRLEPGMCVDDTGEPVAPDASSNMRYMREVMSRFGLDGRYGVLCDGGAYTLGLSREEIVERVSGSAALLNIMGFVTDRELLDAARQRVFLDIDPGFGQMWQASGLCQSFAGHDRYVTIADRVGQPTCTIPTCGVSWVTTRQPVLLDQWPARPAAGGAITSVGAWRGAYGPVTYQGVTYGLRAHEFRKFARLPELTARQFQLALDISPADGGDIELLRSHGWTLVDPRAATGDPWQYREFIGRSAAEFMVAKGMYVETRSGWFSDRSICYLASGRPVIAQKTGFEDSLPTRCGLLSFSTLDEAADAVDAIDGDYERHSIGARRIAEEFFDSSKVLTTLMEKLELW